VAFLESLRSLLAAIVNLQRGKPVASSEFHTVSAVGGIGPACISLFV